MENLSIMNNWKKLLVQACITALLLIPLYDRLFKDLPFEFVSFFTSNRMVGLRALLAILGVSICFNYMETMGSSILPLKQRPPYSELKFPQHLAANLGSPFILFPVYVLLLVTGGSFVAVFLFDAFPIPPNVIPVLKSVCPMVVIVMYVITVYLTHRLPFEQKRMYQPILKRKEVYSSLKEKNRNAT
jgi:hypothetical protein